MSRSKKKEIIYKNALVSQIASKSSIDAKTVDDVLKVFQEVILDNINNSYDTSINGFVSFQIITTAPRVGIDPNTNARIKLPSLKRVNVRVSESFQKRIEQEEIGEVVE